MVKFRLLMIILAVFIISGCSGDDEYDMDEIEGMAEMNRREILSKTVHKPLLGKEYKAGKVGGTFIVSTMDEPKSFNIINNFDSSAKDILSPLMEYLASYDPDKREFKPNLGSFEIIVNDDKQTMILRYTLRDDIYWTTFDGKVKEKVTSDDVVFWYNEIDGNEALKLSTYSGQFVTMPDGTKERVTIHKIDDLVFEFRFPALDSNPVLSTNMIFGPRYIYEKALRERGIDGVLNILTLDTDVKKIPSIGQRHIVEYTPGMRIVMKRNPYYFKKDKKDVSLPYTDTIVYRIIFDMNTEALLFKNGELDYTSVRHSELESFIKNEERDYTVYNGGATLGSEFISFNQNPAKITRSKHKWFSSTEFRQAMSCIVNRDRIIRQVYRGLAEPAEHFFAKANIAFDPKIKQRYLYNPAKAVSLLESAGFKRGSDGFMYDNEGVLVEFDIITNANNNMRMDIAAIFADEAAKIGIKVNVKGMDFEKVVEMLTSTYDWDSLIMSLGSNYWPTSGSNVWLSSGRLHLWHPLQSEPAADWEARIDYLYNKGSVTPDIKEAKKYWDEYQRILLDQCPIIYIAHIYSFMAIRNKWDNVYYDTLNGMKSEYLFLKE